MGSESEAKTGVFICDCGRKIADFLELAELESGAKGIPGVVLVQRERYCCSKKGLYEMKEATRKQGLNRIVVAGCTPRTHEHVFKEALEEVGLSGDLFEMANIREQCAWVHADDQAAATSKALDLIRMGVIRVALAHPREGLRINVTPVALVIGGGIAGLTAALAVANGGFPVKLVEKEERLGGQVVRLHKLHPGDRSAREFVEERVESVKEHPAIETLVAGRVADISGSVGDYRITVEQEGGTSKFNVGAIIVAIGAQECSPNGIFGHDGAKVITQLELEEALRERRVDAQQVVIVLDGAGMPQYSSLPAMAALKNSILLKRRDPAAEVSVLYKSLSADVSQKQIREARDLGVRFVRYGERATPIVTDEAVEVYDQARGEEAIIPHDLVVLALPLVPQDDAVKIASMLRTSIDRTGFVLEPNVRLRPGTHVPDAIYVCGSAHYPAGVDESVFQAYRAGARTLYYLSEGHVSSEASPAMVIEELCTGCGTCVAACPVQAISMEEREGILSVSRIEPSLCKRCGNCTVVCPVKAIVMEPYTDRELIAQINAALASPAGDQPRILAFLCEWSGYAAADLAGAEGCQYPADLRIIRLGCSAKLDPYHVLWSFLMGADGVLVGACDPGMCHYVEGNRYAVERVERLQEMLKDQGFDSRRLRLRWFKPDDAQEFVEAVTEFTDEIEYLGHSHLHSAKVGAWDAPLTTAPLLSSAVPGKS